MLNSVQTYMLLCVYFNLKNGKLCANAITKCQKGIWARGYGHGQGEMKHNNKSL